MIFVANNLSRQYPLQSLYLSTLPILQVLILDLFGMVFSLQNHINEEYVYCFFSN